jgi:hypothetical protein
VVAGGSEELGPCAGDVDTGGVDEVGSWTGDVDTGGVVGGRVTVEDTGGVVAGAEVVGEGLGEPPPLSASAGTAMPMAPRATAPATITIRLRTCDSSRSVVPRSGTLTRIHAVGR